jgi:spermidine synthase
MHNFTRAIYQGSVQKMDDITNSSSDVKLDTTTGTLVSIQYQWQSKMHRDASYHESIVHPVMITHPNPKRVAIVGGDKGATLREVLKHKTVESTAMFGTTSDFVELAREYLLEWSDCSDITDSSKCCFDDERAEAKFDDVVEYFVETFYNDNSTRYQREDEYDIIIMDTLDPNDGVFVQSIYNGLSHSGILVIQVNAVPLINVTEKLEEVGFESIHVYEERHYITPSSFLVAFKDYETRADWYRNEAEVEIHIQKRVKRSKSGNPLLRYFDGPTMMGYQTPPKAFEHIYCLHQDIPDDCSLQNELYAKHRRIIPVTDLEVRNSTVGEHAGRGIFALNAVEAGSLFDPSENMKSFHVLPSTWAVIEAMSEVSEELGGVETFIDGYGYDSVLLVRSLQSGFFGWLHSHCLTSLFSLNLLLFQG